MLRAPPVLLVERSYDFGAEDDSHLNLLVWKSVIAGL